MKLALMNGDIVPRTELRTLGFEAVQMFFSGKDNSEDPTTEQIDAILDEGDVVLAAMTLHAGLVRASGLIPNDVDRVERCVEKTAALEGRFGHHDIPMLIWHPSGYPDEVDDSAMFDDLCEGLSRICKRAEKCGVSVAVEITRAGSIGSAETFRHIVDRVNSPALQVCMDAANFVPDRTPLERAVRMLGPRIAIAHGKDCSFGITGEVSDYGPIGTGQLDHEMYVHCLLRYAKVAYFVLEYYKDRKQLLTARDIILAAIGEQ